MSLGVALPFTCVSLQENIDKYFAEKVLPYKKAKSNGFLKFLKSRANRDGITMIQDDANQNGIKRRIKMLTRRPLCFKLCKGDWACNDLRSGLQVSPYQHEFTLDDTPFYPCDNDDNPMTFKWDYRKWQDLCINQPRFFDETITQALMRIDELVNKELLTVLAAKLATACGSNGIAGGTIQVPLFLTNTTTAVPSQNPYVFTAISNEYEKQRMSGAYAMFGGMDFKDYLAMKGIASGSAIGYDMSKMPEDFDFFYDLDFNTVLGSDIFVGIPYGAMQLVQYTENIGYGAIDFPNQKKMVLTTPNGLKVDMDWVYNADIKCNYVEVALTCYAELVVVPGGGCGLQDCVNGLTMFQNCALGGMVDCPVSAFKNYQLVASYIDANISVDDTVTDLTFTSSPAQTCTGNITTAGASALKSAIESAITAATYTFDTVVVSIVPAVANSGSASLTVTVLNTNADLATLELVLNGVATSESFVEI